MKSATPRKAGYVCQLCQLSRSGLLLRPRATPFFVPAKVLEPDSSRRSISTGAGGAHKSQPAKAPSPYKHASVATTRAPRASMTPATTSTASSSTPPSRGGGGAQSDPATTLTKLVQDGQKITSSSTVPDELDVLEFLEKCQKFSQVIIFGKSDADTVQRRQEKDQNDDDDDDDAEDTPASALLDLDEASSLKGKTISSSSVQLTLAFRQMAAAKLSELIYTVLSDPKVFITPEMLHYYVRVQALLGKPEYLPEIFHLYATKSIPNARSSSSPITYSTAWPRSPKNAIPRELSDAALEAAIAKRDLPLALSVIDTTVCAPAFRTNKLLRKASLPLAALGLTPFCAYAGASYVAHWQNTYDVNIATYMILAGIMAYVGTVGVVGFVAVTTSNDQMERVVWQPGARLRDRWLREEERMYFDRVAMAWGFKERWRRGEERGEDWDALREFIGRRQMVLDKSELIEGME